MSTNGGSDPRVLSRDDIMRAQDLKRELVEVPEWGGSVYVRGLTGSERGLWEQSLSRVQPTAPGREAAVQFHLEEMRVTLCTLCLVDENGARLFKDQEVKLLGRKSSQALQRVYDVAARLSAIGEGAVAQEVKDSEAVLASESDSASA